MGTLNEFVVYCPEADLYFLITEGDGTNLWQADIDEGYVDYFLYEYYDSVPAPYTNTEIDGGQCMLKKPYRELTESEIVHRAFGMVFDNPDHLTYRVVEHLRVVL